MRCGRAATQKKPLERSVGGSTERSKTASHSRAGWNGLSDLDQWVHSFISYNLIRLIIHWESNPVRWAILEHIDEIIPEYIHVFNSDLCTFVEGETPSWAVSILRQQIQPPWVAAVDEESEAMHDNVYGDMVWYIWGFDGVCPCESRDTVPENEAGNSELDRLRYVLPTRTHQLLVTQGTGRVSNHDCAGCRWLQMVRNTAYNDDSWHWCHALWRNKLTTIWFQMDSYLALETNSVRPLENPILPPQSSSTI